MTETILKPLILELMFVSDRLACSIFVPTMLGMKVIRCSTLPPGRSGSILQEDTERTEKSSQNVEVLLAYEWLTLAPLTKDCCDQLSSC